MKTFDDRKTSAASVRRVSLAPCMILAGAALVLGLYPAWTTAQPEAKPGKVAGNRLNHIDLVVANVAEDRAFFEKHFGFHKIVEIGDKLAVLTDGTDFTLVLSSPELGTEVGKLQRDGTPAPKDKDASDAKKPIEYPAGFHIGFHQDSREAVDEMYKKLKAAGIAVQQPKEHHGAWTFYVRAPGGYFVEVFHQSRRGDGR